MAQADNIDADKAEEDGPPYPPEKWIPYPVNDSSEYLHRSRRGPWPKHRPPRKDTETVEDDG